MAGRLLILDDDETVATTIVSIAGRRWMMSWR
jgi:hypothetical protein